LVRAEQYLESNLLNEFLNIIKSIEITEEEADLKAQLNNKSKRTKK
jgi:hypothetical protein